MTLQELETRIGPRGSLAIITQGEAANRSLVKRWCRLQGIAGSVVDGLTKSSLENVYNDTSDSALDCMRGLGHEVPPESADVPQIENQPRVEGPIVGVSTPPLVPQTTGLGKAIEDLIHGTLGGIKPGLDEAAVLALIENKIQEFGVLRTDVVIRSDDGAMRVEVKGAHKTFATLLKIAACRQDDGFRSNIMLSGPTGSGKTRACKDAAKALGLEFFSNGAVSQDYQLIGFKDAAGTYHKTPLREAFARPAWYLFDEFDSSDNSPMLCVAAVMANDGYDFPDMWVARHPDSVITAAGNTWGNGATADFCGRVKVDGAIRSRFPVRLAWDYDESLERRLCGDADWAARVQKARALARKAGLKVIIDPRMTKAGAALIRGGFTSDEAAALTYLADLAPDQRAMVEG